MAAKGLKWLRLYEWGGLNNQDASTTISPDSAQLARNHIIRRNGAVEKRYKKTSYGGSTSGHKATAIQGMIRAYSDEGGYGQTGYDTDAFDYGDLTYDDYTATQETKALVWLQADPADSSQHHLYYGDDTDGSGTSLLDCGDVGTSSTFLRAVQWGNRAIYMAIQSAGFYYWGTQHRCRCSRWVLGCTPEYAFGYRGCVCGFGG